MKTASTHRELLALHRGTKYVLGLDEAGRGAIAGPLSVGYAVLPIQDLLRDEKGFFSIFAGVRDSKKFSSEKARKDKQMNIAPHVIVAGAILVSAEDVDRLGINGATFYASLQALEAVLVALDIDTEDSRKVLEIFVDQGISSEALRAKGYEVSEMVKGDSQSISIAAASIYAKVFHDEEIRRIHAIWGNYELPQNKGYYANERHINLIRRHGVAPFYRRSYKTIRNLIEEGVPEVYTPPN